MEDYIEINKDKLDMLFDIQYDFQNELENLERIKDPKMKQEFVNQTILALHEEAVEAMKESAYKNPNYVEFGWKKQQEWNEDNFKEEIIDLMHFVINLCVAVNMKSDEFYKIFINKNKKNRLRQKDENFKYK